MIKVWVGIRVGLRCTKQQKIIGVLLVLVGVDSYKDGETNVCVATFTSCEIDKKIKPAF